MANKKKAAALKKPTKKAVPVKKSRVRSPEENARRRDAYALRRLGTRRREFREPVNSAEQGIVNATPAPTSPAGVFVSESDAEKLHKLLDQERGMKDFKQRERVRESVRRAGSIAGLLNDVTELEEVAYLKALAGSLDASRGEVVRRLVLLGGYDYGGGTGVVRGKETA